MNLFFRLLMIIIQGFLRSPLGFMDTSVVTFRVWPLDLDINRHMTNSRYLSIMDLGRTDLLIRTGLAKLTWQKKMGSVLGSATIRWRLGLTIFQKYELHTKVIAWDDKWFYLDQKVLNENHVVTHAIVKAIFVRKGGSIMAKDLVEMATQGRVSPISPPIPEAVLKWNESEEAMRQEAHTFAAQHF